MAGVSLSGVTKYYGTVRVTENLNLDIKDGEFVVLVGPSGCGKTTILRMIAGLEEVSAGDIRIGARLVNDLPPKDRDVAMVFQNYALYPHMRVRGNLSFALQQRRVPKPVVSRRVEQAATLLNITELLERRPRELSGGQRQRVARGRALVREPQLYLFDEPLSNLDAQLRAQMSTEIKKLHQQDGRTVVYVTHDQVEAMTLAHRIVVLRGGEVQQIGTPHELYFRPQSMFVAGFIGSPGMNFIPARLVGDDGLWVDIGVARLRVPDRLVDICARLRDREVVFGIRPESLRPAADSADAVALPVVVVEPQGAEAMTVVAVNGTDVVARCVAGSEPTAGTLARFAFEMSHVHLFDRATGKALLQ